MGKSLVDGRYLYGGIVSCHSLQWTLALLVKITLNLVVLYALIGIQNLEMRCIEPDTSNPPFTRL